MLLLKCEALSEWWISPHHRVDASLSAPRVRLGREAELGAELVDHIEVARRHREHVDDRAQRAFGPAAQRATHTAPPVVKPASRLVATRQRAFALIAINLDGAAILFLRLELLVCRL